MKILFTQKQIHAKVKELAKKIRKDFGKSVTCVVVLTGAMIFFVDLMRELQKLGCEVKFYPVKVSSYEGTKSSGRIKLLLDADVKGKILIVEDIIDTGLTLSFLKRHLERKGCRVKIVSFLDKKVCRKVKMDADYTGYVVPNRFVIGYGFDVDGRYRELPYVAALD